MTNEHLRILLDEEEDSQLLHNVAERFAQANVPPDALAALRVGRVVALRKPGGGVHALVVGDVLRRLVGRVLSQTSASQLQQACLPYQFGLSTRAGSEALARVLHLATEVDPRMTVLSVDAAGAYDHVSRGAMLGALHARPDLQALLPYARQFYATASSYTWGDVRGECHAIAQAEGRGTGGSLTAWALLPRCPSRTPRSAGLPPRRGSRVRVPTLWRPLGVSGNLMPSLRTLFGGTHGSASTLPKRGSSGMLSAKSPLNIRGLQPDGGDPVWVGDWALPRDKQGLNVLGTPFGSDAYIECQLARKREAHNRLLQAIPSINDLQAAWLLLRYCAAPRANYWPPAGPHSSRCRTA